MLSGHQSPLCNRQFASVIRARKQVAINIGRKGHDGVAKALLDNLQWQFETAVSPPIDAPACIELAEGMEGLLWLALIVRHLARSKRFLGPPSIYCIGAPEGVSFSALPANWPHRQLGRSESAVC
jgi:hypothetical protein